MNHALVWGIAGCTILLILAGPRRIPEAVWACGGAGLLVLFKLISPRDALAAVRRGTDVYLFLTGMMVLAELARREGFFDWVAVHAVEWAKGSPKRLFAIVYAVGTVVTIFLSNDATAVVLTPAVLAAVKKARARPLPYLLICAFIANAASFVLPISNPANLVVYGSKMPALGVWFRSFGLPSLVSIVVTFAVLELSCRNDLKGAIESQVDGVSLSAGGKLAAYGIGGAAVALMIASALDIDLGLPTLLAAIAATALVAFHDRNAPAGIFKHISWSVIVLVAGLFVMVAAVDQAGVLAMSQGALRKAEALGAVEGSLTAAFGVALSSNIANNLPVGLIAGNALHAGVSMAIRNAVLIGVDLGPNLSVSGSLATILWLIALRRDGEDISFWKFLTYGLLLMPVALALAVLAAVL
ncbi:MAG TPA: arsenic transporter [Bryobacteraceae bacterium]|jgi:arsenical pump membrane protein|nr:arsenic transporter [Bryobacteraceae bacterium]